MDKSNGTSKTAGRVAMLMLVVGIILFFLGIFGPTRTPLLVSLAVIALSFGAFFIEELTQRKAM